MAHLGAADFKDRLQTLQEQRDQIQKGLYGDNDIEKAEGARGGKVIGHTKSGKPIYANANHEGHKDFSIAEHNDAIDLHKKVRDDYHKNNQSTNEDKEANDHAYEQQKEHIGRKNYLMRDMTTEQARNATAESEKKETTTNEDDTHSVNHRGSKYNSMPGESKEDFHKRAKKSIKEDHKEEVEFKDEKNEGPKYKSKEESDAALAAKKGFKPLNAVKYKDEKK